MSGKQIGDDWQDRGGHGRVWAWVALSLDGKKVVSEGNDSAVRLWDINTGKVVVK